MESPFKFNAPVIRIRRFPARQNCDHHPLLSPAVDAIRHGTKVNANAKVCASAAFLGVYGQNKLRFTRACHNPKRCCTKATKKRTKTDGFRALVTPFQRFRTAFDRSPGDI
jgi:hypothetical protein